MSAMCITKKVFMYEIYHCILNLDASRTITSDFIHVLKKYDLYQYLVAYLKGGSFPEKLAWKYIFRNEVHRIEQVNWRINLRNKGVNRYRRIQPDLNVNILYIAIKSNLALRQKLMPIIYMLTIVEEDEIMMCPECNNTLTDSVDHYVMRCPNF